MEIPKSAEGSDCKEHIDNFSVRDALADLDRAEDLILNLLDITSKTSDELANIPNCNSEILKEKITSLIDSVSDAQSLILRHVSVLDSSQPEALPSQSYVDAKLSDVEKLVKDSQY